MWTEVFLFFSVSAVQDIVTTRVNGSETEPVFLFKGWLTLTYTSENTHWTLTKFWNNTQQCPHGKWRLNHNTISNTCIIWSEILDSLIIAVNVIFSAFLSFVCFGDYNEVGSQNGESDCSGEMCHFRTAVSVVVEMGCRVAFSLWCIQVLYVELCFLIYRTKGGILRSTVCENVTNWDCIWKFMSGDLFVL